MNLRLFLAELRRRNVYKATVAYGLFAWLVIQLATQVFPFFEIPGWTIRLVILLLIFATPFVAFFAWAFELTPEGLKRTQDVVPQESITHQTGRRLTVAIVGVLAIALAIEAFHLVRQKPARLGSTVSPGVVAAPEKSIAVLPFENLSDEKGSAYFTDGIQDEVLTALARIADLKVISRTSVMQYRKDQRPNLRDIGRQLGVAYILEGAVRCVGKEVRISAQLIDARTDLHQWAENYDRPLDDVFAIQTEIAETIAARLQAKLSPSEKAAIERPPTSNLAAFDLFLRAKNLYADTSDQIQAKEKLPQAAQLLGQAVARDPAFIQAWCLLARVHGDIYWQGFDHTSARLDLATAALQSALRLQPDGGEIHLALASYYYHGFRDYQRARTELEIARHSLPNNAEIFEYTGYIDRRQSRWAEATRNLQSALQLDPRNFGIVQQLALAYEVQHRYANQAQMCELALAIVPNDPYTLMTRAQIPFAERADIKPFQTMLASLIAQDPKLAPDVDDPDHALCERTREAPERALKNYPPDGVGINGVNYPRSYWEGVVARCQGDPAKAQAAFAATRLEVEKIVKQQPDFAAALSFLGMIDAGLGRKEEALREGKRACGLLPISKDSIDGTAFAVNLALIYTWTGEKDAAVAQIAAVERMPNYLSYGVLKLHPYWDSLRDDPRFNEILAALAPKPGS